MKVALDTNCFIDAVKADAHANAAMKLILDAHNSGRITAMVSRHTLAELPDPLDPAHQLAQTLGVFPYWPVGTIAEQVGTIEQLAGTWEDARHNQETQKELERLAKSGNDIRDRGAFLDTLLGGADRFVTSDKQLVGSGPAKRIPERFPIRVLRPADLAREIQGSCTGDTLTAPFTALGRGAFPGHR
jgi:predicted nucleic acid-binding protein